MAMNVMKYFLGVWLILLSVTAFAIDSRVVADDGTSFLVEVTQKLGTFSANVALYGDVAVLPVENEGASVVQDNDETTQIVLDCNDEVYVGEFIECDIVTNRPFSSLSFIIGSGDPRMQNALGRILVESRYDAQIDGRRVTIGLGEAALELGIVATIRVQSLRSVDSLFINLFAVKEGGVLLDAQAQLVGAQVAVLQDPADGGSVTLAGLDACFEPAARMPLTLTTNLCDRRINELGLEKSSLLDQAECVGVYAGVPLVKSPNHARIVPLTNIGGVAQGWYGLNWQTVCPDYITWEAPWPEGWSGESGVDPKPHSLPQIVRCMQQNLGVFSLSDNSCLLQERNQCVTYVGYAPLSDPENGCSMRDFEYQFDGLVDDVCVEVYRGVPIVRGFGGPNAPIEESFSFVEAGEKVETWQEKCPLLFEQTRGINGLWDLRNPTTLSLARNCIDEGQGAFENFDLSLECPLEVIEEGALERVLNNPLQWWEESAERNVKKASWLLHNLQR